MLFQNKGSATLCPPSVRLNISMGEQSLEQLLISLSRRPPAAYLSACKRHISAGKLTIASSTPPGYHVLILHEGKKLVLSAQFPLDRRSAVLAFERSYPAVPLARQLVDQGFTILGPLVQKNDTLNFYTPKEDRIRTVSQRTKPNSRTTFIGEQPNPWNLLQLQVVTSRPDLLP